MIGPELVSYDLAQAIIPGGGFQPGFQLPLVGPFGQQSDITSIAVQGNTLYGLLPTMIGPELVSYDLAQAIIPGGGFQPGFQLPLVGPFGKQSDITSIALSSPTDVPEPQSITMFLVAILVFACVLKGRAR
jgi:hypothetical protein